MPIFLEHGGLGLVYFFFYGKWMQQELYILITRERRITNEFEI
jgi:hypothetical protein